MRHHSPLPATSSIPPKKHQETLKTYLLLRGIAWPCGAHPNPCESTGEFLLGQRFASWFGALFGGCRLFLAPLLATRRGCFWLNHLHPLVRAAELLVLRLEAHNLHLVLALLDAPDVLELQLELHHLELQLFLLPLELVPVPLQRLELLPCLPLPEHLPQLLDLPRVERQLRLVVPLCRDRFILGAHLQLRLVPPSGAPSAPTQASRPPARGGKEFFRGQGFQGKHTQTPHSTAHDKNADA
mmetsp:Transcript_24316/g.61277  ORF Transcript_24316/g.61277 Transcript_24316/m.61277 type:complete len:241 (-) Transcript_24316:149-871(-)